MVREGGERRWSETSNFITTDRVLGLEPPILPTFLFCLKLKRYYFYKSEMKANIAAEKKRKIIRMKKSKKRDNHRCTTVKPLHFLRFSLSLARSLFLFLSLFCFLSFSLRTFSTYRTLDVVFASPSLLSFFTFSHDFVLCNKVIKCAIFSMKHYENKPRESPFES